MTKPSQARFRRNKRHPNNCPICGIFVCKDYQDRSNGDLPEEAKNHKCDPEFLKRSERVTDAVMDRDYEPPYKKPYGSRLAAGFEMLGEFGDGNNDDDDDE